MRHLANANELMFYAALSCAGSFIARSFPGLWIPLMLLRLGVLAYCFWILILGEGNKVLAGIISSSVLIGAIGGYWDYLEVWLRFDNEKVNRTISISFFGLLALGGIALQVYINHEKASKK